MRRCGCRMETVCGSQVKQIELEKRLSALKVRLSGTDVLTLQRWRVTYQKGCVCVCFFFYFFFSLHVQQTLREKLVELQALMAEEKRLTRGEKTAPLPSSPAAEVS